MPERTLDGTEMALINSRLQGVVGKMINTLGRTGRSGVLNSARDFSCCILTAAGDLLAVGDSLPIHVMHGPDLMARDLVETHPRLSRGDAFLHNDPYRGNSHAADHCLLVPVLDDEDIHRFTVLVKAHQADCGNALPTTYAATARDVYEEGALIFPCVQVQRDYEDIDDIIRMCRRRIRVPDQWWGDYLAMVGSARIGERLLGEMAAELGWELLDRFAGSWFDYSERRMARALGDLPSGSVTATGAHDPFPGVEDGIDLSVTVDVDGETGRIDVDLRDNPDCQPCGLNLTEATSRTAAMLAIFNSIGPGVPVNAGSFRRIEVRLRENCCVGIPRHPASCSVATTNLADRLANLVQRAIGEHAPGRGMAEAGFCLVPALAVISGRDPRNDGRPFVNEIYLSITGGAGAPTEDAWLSIGHVGNGGFLLRDSVEIDELRYPLMIRRQELIPDSEGAGEFRGAPGARVEYGPIGCRMDVSYASDGTVYPARGVRGGRPGAPAGQMLRRRDGGEEPVDACAQVTLEDGEAIVSLSAGGGGYGDPVARDPERVLTDVTEGWISPERAEKVYGVVVRDDSVDATATRALRGIEGGR
jgi:N-methylhydantoinase B